MEKFSFFNDVNGDRVYYAEDFARHLSTYFTNGIFNNGCQVLANNNDMSVNVSIGSANINGYRYDNNVIKKIVLETADGVLNRIDNIVIRLDLTNRNILTQVIKGVPAENPIAPDLVRTSTIYDLRIATVHIPAGTITITQDLVSDRRFFSEECGNVISAVQTPNTENLFIQIETKFNNLLSSMNNSLTKFDTAYKEFISRCDREFTSKLDNWTSDFDNWFNHIKGKLEGDVATNLQKEIDEINDKLIDSQIIVSEEEPTKDCIWFRVINKETLDNTFYLETEELDGSEIYISEIDNKEEKIVNIGETINNNGDTILEEI